MYAQKRDAKLTYVDDDETYIVIADDTNIERQVLNKVYIEELMQCLTKLERFLVSQRQNDMTYTEISEQVGFSRAYIQKLYKRALEKMKNFAWQGDENGDALRNYEKFN